MIEKVCRKAIAVAAVLITVCGSIGGASATPAPKPPVPFTGLRIVMGTSMGGLALGAKQSKVDGRFPKGDCTVDQGVGSCSYDAPQSAYTVQMSSYTSDVGASPRVILVILQSTSQDKAARKLTTSSGIGIGSTKAQVKRAYPHWTCPPEPSTCYKTTNGATTEFDFDKGHVEQIQLSHS